MIKVISCDNKNCIKKLKIFLDKRRQGKKFDTKVVSNILVKTKKLSLRKLKIEIILKN